MVEGRVPILSLLSDNITACEQARCARVCQLLAGSWLAAASSSLSPGQVLVFELEEVAGGAVVGHMLF